MTDQAHGYSLRIEPGETTEAFIRRVVETAPVPTPEVIDRLRALLRLHVRAAAEPTDGEGGA